MLNKCIINTKEKLFLFKKNYYKNNLNVFIMKNKSHTIYTNICLSLLKIFDPHKKHLGRPNKYSYHFYIKHILHILINGLSWNKLSSIICISTDLIRKKYVKW